MSGYRRGSSALAAGSCLHKSEVFILSARIISCDEQRANRAREIVHEIHYSSLFTAIAMLNNRAYTNKVADLEIWTNKDSTAEDSDVKNRHAKIG